MIQSVRVATKRKRKDSGDEEGSNDGYDRDYQSNNDQPLPDLGALQVNTLRRFKKHYRIQTRPGTNKQQLVEVRMSTECECHLNSCLLQQLMRHFRTIPVNDKEAITYFIYMVKMNKNKLDHAKGTE